MIVSRCVSRIARFQRTVKCRLMKTSAPASISTRASPASVCNLVVTHRVTTRLSHHRLYNKDVKSYWMKILENMASHDLNAKDDVELTAKIENIRDLLGAAIRSKRSQDSGDLMPNIVSTEICHFYQSMNTPSDRLAFFSVLSHDLGVDHEAVSSAASALSSASERGLSSVLKAEEQLRQSLEPLYMQLLVQIGKLDHGVKFVVDLRKDLLDILYDQSLEIPVNRDELHALNMAVRGLLAHWFSVGFLGLERVTWDSPCSILEKVMEYEAVHPVQNWDDIKRRVGPHRRCYIFTHRCMPGEPIVVLHTALQCEVADNIQKVLTEPFPEEEDPDKITTAIFYSISSTQKGLTGVELGTFLIKQVVQQLQHEFNNISQFLTLSPIPGFYQWLKFEMMELPLSDGSSLHVGRNSILTAAEGMQLQEVTNQPEKPPVQILKEVLEEPDWPNKADVVQVIKAPLMRLCARYLYLEKRRGFVLNPVANFHIRNGAWLWRLNWLADCSPRGLESSCGMMVNYKYVLEDVDQNNQQYLLKGTVAASPQFIELTKDAWNKSKS